MAKGGLARRDLPVVRPHRVAAVGLQAGAVHSIQAPEPVRAEALRVVAARYNFEAQVLWPSVLPRVGLRAALRLARRTGTPLGNPVEVL